MTDTDAPAPRELGHVHLKVRDLETSLPFYREIMGLEIEERHRRFVFLTYGDHHHDVALQELGADADPPGGGVGLYHAAFEIGDGATLAAVDRRLRERGVAVTPVDHGISKALYFDDPDGNGLEVYLDTRDRAEAWRGRNEPFDPATLGE